MFRRILLLGVALGLAACATQRSGLQDVERDAYGRAVVR